MTQVSVFQGLALGLLLYVCCVDACGKSRQMCYECDSDDGFKSSKACKWEGPNLDEVHKVDYANYKKECYRCSKTKSGDTVVRGCMDKETYDNVDDSFNFKNEGSCEKQGQIEICVCEDDHCNSATLMTSSIVMVIFAALTKILL